MGLCCKYEFEFENEGGGIVSGLIKKKMICCKLEVPSPPPFVIEGDEMLKILRIVVWSAVWTGIHKYWLDIVSHYYVWLLLTTFLPT